MARLGVGIVGLGGWAATLTTSLEKSERLELVGCWSRSPETTRRFAERHGCRATAGLDELLALPGLGGLVVTTPNAAHRAVAEAAAGAGKHVFVDKPLANTLEDAQAIIDACERAGVVLAVGHCFRRHAGIRRLRALAEDGALGRVTLAEAAFSRDTGLRLGPDRWRWHRSELPGGCLMQIGIHQVDNLIYCLGPVAEVSAYLARLEIPAEVEDVATVMLRFRSGALATLTSDWASAERFTLSLYGTRACATFDLAGGLTVIPRGSRAAEAVAVAPNDYLLDELDDFAACALEGKTPEVDGRVALAPLAVVLAAIRSAEERRPVALAS